MSFSTLVPGKADFSANLHCAPYQSLFTIPLAGATIGISEPFLCHSQTSSLSSTRVGSGKTRGRVSDFATARPTVPENVLVRRGHEAVSVLRVNAGVPFAFQLSSLPSGFIQFTAGHGHGPKWKRDPRRYRGAHQHASHH